MKKIKKYLKEVGAGFSVKENVLYVEFSDYSNGDEKLGIIFNLIEKFSPSFAKIARTSQSRFRTHIDIKFEACVVRILTSNTLRRIPGYKMYLDKGHKNLFKHLVSLLLGPIPARKKFEADQIISCDAFSFAEHIHDEYYIVNAELTKGKKKNFLKFEGSRFRVFAMGGKSRRKDCPIIKNCVSAIRVGGEEIIRFPAADAAKLGIKEV